MDEKKSFWVTVPGILTGIGTVIAAIASLYIALHPAPNGTPSSGTAPATTNPLKDSSPSTWPLIAEETFSTESSGWTSGDFSYEATPRFELRMVNGRYRWDVGFNSPARSSRIYAPYGAMVDFNAGIDIKIINSTDLISATMHIGDAGDNIYSFNVSSNGQFSLTRTNPSSKELEADFIGWTPISVKSGGLFDPNSWNRMMIVVENQLIKLYVNSELQAEYRDIEFKGGKIGVSVMMYNKGSAVIDFDNYVIRRKPPV